MISDAELVRAVKSGERRLYSDLVARYERPAMAAALQVVRNYHEAQDAAQEAFVMAYQRLGDLRDGAAFGGWVLAIARNVAFRLARRPRLAAWPSAEPAADSGDRADGASERLLAAIGRLPDQEALVIHLVYFGGHSVAAVAEMTGRPVGTVTKQLSRGRQRLRDALKEIGHDER